MAPPRSVPPAATPQRIPVPGSGPPGAISAPPVAPPAWPVSQSEPSAPQALAAPETEVVELDVDVVEEATDDELDTAPTPAMPELADAQAALAPLRPMRRLAIGEPDSSRPSAPPPIEQPPAPAATPPATTAPAGTPPGLQGSSGAAAPVGRRPEGSSISSLPPAMPSRSSVPPAHAALAPAPTADDDAEHAEDRIGLTPEPPQFAPSPVDTAPPSSNPDDVDTPVPAAPVHVSAPPPFVPPPSPLLPAFASVPPVAPPVVPPAEASSRAPRSDAIPAAEAASPPEPPRRPSRPPPVVPEAVVRSIQPGTYQSEHASFDAHAPLDEEEVRLSETDLEISTTGEPPEVEHTSADDLLEPAPGEFAASSAARAVVSAAAAANTVTLVEAPVPDIALPAEPAPAAGTAGADLKKPPPPKRTAKPALPSATVRRRPWWETLFGDDFARAHRSPTPRQLAREVNYMVTTLALTQNQVVLDLGCGQGEHTVELTRRGVSVVGYDLSVFQLAMAGDRAQREAQKINFLQGDMREMAFDSMFDAVVCWDTTFGYFEEEKNVDVARRIWASLKPGGSLLLHVMNRDFAAKESPTNIWFEGDGCVCMDDVDFDWITSRLRVKRSLILDDGRSKELHYSVRLYNLSELGKLLHDVGFRVAHVSGDVSTPGAFFGPSSPYLIIRAQRP